MNKLLLLVLVLSLLIWAACNTNKKNPPPPDEESPTEGEESNSWDPNLHDIWVLTNLSGEELEIGTPRPQLELFPEEGRLQGQGSCNRLFGKVKAEERKISFSEIGSTKMHCGEYMERETKFLQELGRAERYVVRNGELFIFWGDQLILLFHKID